MVLSQFLQFQLNFLTDFNIIIGRQSPQPGIFITQNIGQVFTTSCNFSLSFNYHFLRLRQKSIYCDTLTSICYHSIVNKWQRLTKHGYPSQNLFVIWFPCQYFSLGPGVHQNLIHDFTMSLISHSCTHGLITHRLPKNETQLSSFLTCY